METKRLGALVVLYREYQATDLVRSLDLTYYIKNNKWYEDHPLCDPRCCPSAAAAVNLIECGSDGGLCVVSEGHNAFTRRIELQFPIFQGSLKSVVTSKGRFASARIVNHPKAEPALFNDCVDIIGRLARNRDMSLQWVLGYSELTAQQVFWQGESPEIKSGLSKKDVRVVGSQEKLP